MTTGFTGASRKTCMDRSARRHSALACHSTVTCESMHQMLPAAAA